MEPTTTTTTAKQSAFDSALDDYNRARQALDAIPIATTTSDAETVAMDALDAAERRLLNQKPQNLSDVRAMAEIVWADPDGIPCEDRIAAVLNGLRKLDGQPSRTFSATAWLEQFEILGGGWTNIDGEVSLLAPVPVHDGLKAMLWQLDTTGSREQVKAAIRHKDSAASVAPIRWEAVRRAYDEAAKAMKAHEAIENPHRYDSTECKAHEAKTDRLATAEGEAFDAMMLHPAPDASALSFKLTAHSAFTKGMHWPTADKIAKQLAADAANLLPKVA